MSELTRFIPPWNTYDLNTIRALEGLSFRCLSAGETGEARKSSRLKYLPATCELSKLRAAVRVARRIPDLQPIIVVYFHAYDFFEVSQDKNKPSYQDFRELLDWLTSQKDIRILSIDQTISLIDDLSARRFINYNSYMNLRLPDSINLPFLRNLCLSGVYFSPRTVDNLKFKLLVYMWSCYLFLGGLTGVIAFRVGSTVLPGLKFKLSICTYGGGVLVVLILFSVLYDLKLTYRETLIFIFSFSAYIGLWCALRRLASRRKRN